MTSFFRLIDDVALRGRWHLGEVTFPRGERFDLLSGKKTGVDKSKIEVQVAGDALDFTLTAFNLPVVSDGLARVVRRIASSSVEVISADVGTADHFWLLNPTVLVDCLDESATHWLKWKPEDGRPDLLGQYRSVTGLRLTKERIPAGVSMFRVWGWPVALVVTNEMKKELEKVGSKGAVFLEV